MGNNFSNTFFKIEYNYSWKQNQVLLENGTETPTPSYSLWNLGMGTEIKSKKGSPLFQFYFTINNVLDKAYQHHLSRLKYAAENTATGRVGVYSMGRNFSVKISVPITFRKANA
jgi:iron complex outermembrane receptor protein